MTDWKKIRKEYETTRISMKKLADKHDVKYATLRSRKSRENWQRNATKDVATKKKSVATQKAMKQLNENKNLNEKQKQFCILYLQYYNATKAYQEAYDVDYRTANANGSRLLANASIKEELERLKKAQRKELFVDALDIQQAWLKQAFADMTDFVEFGQEVATITDEVTGEETDRIFSYVRLKDNAEVDGTLIQEVKQGRDGVSLKLSDRQKALEKLENILSNTGGDGKQIIITDEWADDNE